MFGKAGSCSRHLNEAKIRGTLFLGHFDIAFKKVEAPVSPWLWNGQVWFIVEG